MILGMAVSGKISIYSIYPRDSKISRDKVFVNVDDGQIRKTRLTSSYVKCNNSISFDSFGEYSDNFLLNQLPKLITFHIH